MSYFAVLYTYAPEQAADRDRLRPDHRAWLAELAGAGTVATSGPFLDGRGALIVVSATSASEASEIMAADPFAQADLIAEVRIQEWLPVFGQWS